MIIANDNQWTLIADDWLYTLWHMPSTRPALISLAESCDVFACSVGDSDQGFDFVYYENSRLIRRYVVEQHYDHPKRVVEDIGVPLPGEASAFEQSDELKIVLAIASSLGIKTDYTEQDLRVYTPQIESDGDRWIAPSDVRHCPVAGSRFSNARLAARSSIGAILCSKD